MTAEVDMGNAIIVGEKRVNIRYYGATTLVNSSDTPVGLPPTAGTYYYFVFASNFNTNFSDLRVGRKYYVPVDGLYFVKLNITRTISGSGVGTDIFLSKNLGGTNDENVGGGTGPLACINLPISIAQGMCCTMIHLTTTDYICAGMYLDGGGSLTALSSTRCTLELARVCSL